MPRPFQSNLLRWYHQNKRDLPWRKNRNPYRILLSEFMLQQTQVQTVIPYYHRFLKEFPTWNALAQAPLDSVLKRWEGLGYYSRARHLHRLAQSIVDDHNGRLPQTAAQLIELPGIGRYTAGAIASIAFGEDVPVVDGNVIRVLTRTHGIQNDVTLPSTKEKLWTLAMSLVPKGQAGDFNQALMELGAMVCTPQPKCERCPVQTVCVAFKKKWQSRLPLKPKKKPTPHVHVGAGVIWKGNQILIGQRPLKGLLGGLWEFPGGKVEAGERLEDCVKREIQEELAVTVTVGEKMMDVQHAYSHFKVTLHVFHCRYRSGKPKAIGCQAWKWVTADQLKRFAFPAANQPIIQALLESARSAPAGPSSK